MPVRSGDDLATIETARLYLRPFTSDDLDMFAAIRSDPEVMRFIGNGKPQSRDQTSARLKAIIEHRNRHGFGLWAATDKLSRDLIGFCGLQHLDNTEEIEVGYCLAAHCWGRGLASEAARASLRYGFEELSSERIVAVVQPENLASCRVLEKVGLKYVRNARFYDTEVKYYDIARDEHRPDDSTYIRWPA
jgi:RimJ/RimL family protein N-acetyltransferase